MVEEHWFLIAEDDAKAFLPPNTGRVVAGIWRIVETRPQDPEYKLVQELEHTAPARPGFTFVAGWQCKRIYSPEELLSAALFRCVISKDDIVDMVSSTDSYESVRTCPDCGAGRRQVNPLRLDTNKLPSRRDVVRILSGEWLVNRRLAGLLLVSRLHGFKLKTDTRQSRQFRFPSRPG